jgi:hypothetical protein
MCFLILPSAYLPLTPLSPDDCLPCEVTLYSAAVLACTGLFVFDEVPVDVARISGITATRARANTQTQTQTQAQAQAQTQTHRLCTDTHIHTLTGSHLWTHI